MKNELLGDSVRVMALLDRDYRGDSEVEAIERQLADSGVDAHIWRKKEIENYLLDAPALSAKSGAPEPVVLEIIQAVTDELRDAVEGQWIALALREADRGIDAATTASSALTAVRGRWAELSDRTAMVPGKEALARVNRELQRAGFKAVSTRSLASHLDMKSVPELLRALESVDRALA